MAKGSATGIRVSTYKNRKDELGVSVNLKPEAARAIVADDDATIESLQKALSDAMPSNGESRAKKKSSKKAKAAKE